MGTRPRTGTPGQPSAVVGVASLALSIYCSRAILNLVDLRLSTFKTLIGRLLEPPRSFFITLLHALAILVHEPQVILRT